MPRPAGDAHLSQEQHLYCALHNKETPSNLFFVLFRRSRNTSRPIRCQGDVPRRNGLFLNGLRPFGWCLYAHQPGLTERGWDLFRLPPPAVKECILGFIYIDF